MPQVVREEISRLYANGKGMSMAEIARKVNVSYTTAYGYTRARQRINPETGERFVSLTEYKEHLARQRINPETGERFVSRTEYEEHLARQRINPETGERFASYTEYQKHLA